MDQTTNMTMLCDFYELTMANGYFLTGKKDTITYFDVFFRRVPDGGGFAIAAGLQQALQPDRVLHTPNPFCVCTGKYRGPRVPA